MNWSIVHDSRDVKFYPNDFWQIVQKIAKFGSIHRADDQLMKNNANIWRDCQQEVQIFTTTSRNLSDSPSTAHCSTTSPSSVNIKSALVDVY